MNKKRIIGIVIAAVLLVTAVTIGVMAGKKPAVPQSVETETIDGDTVQEKAEGTKQPIKTSTPKEGMVGKQTSLPEYTASPETTMTAEGTASPAVREKEENQPVKTPVATKESTKDTVVTKNPTTKPQEKATSSPASKATAKPQANPTVTPAATKTPATKAPVKTEEPSAKVTVSVDASVIGNGTLLKSTTVTVTAGEMASHAVTRALKNAGFSYSNTGSLDHNFYLSAIKKAGIVKNPTVSDHVMEILEDNGVKLKLTKYSSGTLGEFDFTSFSGWRYSVNGSYPGVGMSDYELKDGDRVVLKYTLCLGYDA